mmetsp:Transcript_2657/g.10629  ORF Transcript_2657/g.10629 Transcript_2657/m.10629 type:complete len:311 (-) Transcript_2657:329-1261(-)
MRRRVDGREAAQQRASTVPRAAAFEQGSSKSELLVGLAARDGLGTALALGLLAFGLREGLLLGGSGRSGQVDHALGAHGVQRGLGFKLVRGGSCRVARREVRVQRPDVQDAVGDERRSRVVERRRCCRRARVGFLAFLGVSALRISAELRAQEVRQRADLEHGRLQQAAQRRVRWRGLQRVQSDVHDPVRIQIEAPDEHLHGGHQRARVTLDFGRVGVGPLRGSAPTVQQRRGLGPSFALLVQQIEALLLVLQPRVHLDLLLAPAGGAARGKEPRGVQVVELEALTQHALAAHAGRDELLGDVRGGDESV